VASFHANLLEQYRFGNRFGVDVAATFAGNLGQAGPFHPLLANVGLDKRAEESAFVAAAKRVDIAFIFHVAHRFGTYWERNADMPPLVARVPSWTGLGPEVPAQIAIMRRRLDRARAVVLASRQLLDEGVRCGYLSGERAHVIPSALDACFTAPLRGPSLRPKLAVFVGRLDDNKGVLPFIRSLEHLPEWRAAVVGAGELSDALRRARDAQGLADRVELRGPLDDRLALRQLVEEASVLCVPSRREAFGTVYAEAMASGTFAVGHHQCIDELNGALGIRGGIGLRSQDPSEIAAGISAAHSLDTSRRGLAELARRHYSAERCAEQLAGVLNQ
jgi:glycosyltransferase involved in cell wall biosynthesis